MTLTSWKIFCAPVQQRWIFAVMGCLAITNAYTMRVCLSVAITEMVVKTEISLNNTKNDDTCPATTESTFSNITSNGTYKWDEYTQGIILSSFYWGYIVTQIPGGIIAQKFGGKYTLGLGILCTAIFSVFTPIVVQTYEATGLIVIRTAMGLCGGTIFPGITVLIAQWAPPLERSQINGIVMSGMAVGTVVGNGLSGILIQSSSIGWPIVFYFYGAFGILWFLAWIILCYNDPQVHPFISETEQKYLQETTKEYTHSERRQTPWLHVATSIPVWGYIIGTAGVTWGYFMILTNLPKYMSSVLRFSIAANGLLSALPYVILWFVGITSARLADWLIKSNRMSRSNVRKVCHTCSTIMPMCFIIASSFAGCNRTVVVVLFTIGVGFMGPYYSGIMVNPNDLSPNHSGILIAIGATVAALAGLLGPYVVGILTPNQTLSEWRIVFWITSAIYLVATLMFDLWADGEVQYWNDLDSWNDRQKQIRSKNQDHERIKIRSRPSKQLPETESQSP